MSPITPAPELVDGDARYCFDLNNIDDYAKFLAVKSLPRFSFAGRTARFPAEYAESLGLVQTKRKAGKYKPSSFLFDYQRDISRMAIERSKFAAFVDCGLGKTLIELEFVKHVAKVVDDGKAILIVCPLMVVKQTIAEAERFYGDAIQIEHVHAKDLNAWLASGKSKIGITNYDALTDDIQPGRLAAMVLDESSMLKSAYGKWAQTCIRLGKGLDWKLCMTGTPAPNDRIEYANHAVFLDQYPTVNAFLARFFVNRGQTDNRWELKPHALGPFYRALSHWAIFLTNPATYGWKDNCENIPPINVHVHDIPLTNQQTAIALHGTGEMFVNVRAGGITTRSKHGQLAKGKHNGERVDTNKPGYVRDLVNSWPEESTIIWCHYNDEQDRIAAEFPDAANITGDTEHETRLKLIADFQAGRRKILISKGKILGFGLNLQIATRQVFSGLQDSYETYYQCVKRSNRYGSTRPLNVHIPITELERPMIQTVLEKAKRVQHDTEEQERIFKENQRVTE